ncbi:hypothetical protein BD626DRAFT_612178 [Schizophyllum amplum]|uniref:F-box domain-containing protein n=1 Tax=Schizophyllum amplum TaxID=97359 RepID=A0A550C022_9AGAR|nr:hypothetical protein BD626DRAFT_612178 [Auriculariopsis ampla]
MLDIKQDMRPLLARSVTYANVERQQAGFVPSTAERNEVEFTMSLLASSLPDIDAEIGRLYVLRERVCTQLDISKSVLAPVWRLPVEIISQIFLHVCGTTSEAFDQAVVLARVCLSWRTIAWSIPQLWNHISSSGTHTRTRAVPSFAEQAALSGTLPLHINHLRGSDDALPARLLEELCPHASRWRTLEIGAPCAVFDAIPIIDMPNLADVRIDLVGPPTSESLGFLAGASDLRQLTLKLFPNLGYEWDILQMPPLRTLTRLTLVMRQFTHISLRAVLSALSHCSLSLAYLKVAGGISGADDLSVPSGPTIMNGLLVADLAGAALALLDRVAMPRIEELILRERKHMRHDPLSLLLVFLCHPAHAEHRHLQRLTVAITWKIDQDLFLRCLEKLGELRELRVENDSWDTLGLMTEDTVNHLTCTDDRIPLLPKLSKVVLRFCRRELLQMIQSPLRAMLMSRERPRACASCDVSALEDMQIIVGMRGETSQIYRIRHTTT